MREMMDQFPNHGKITWIGIRPAKKGQIQPVNEIQLDPDRGIEGDHYSGESRIRQVTLIQAEHLESVASLLDREKIDPSETRRNIVVKGINLLAIQERTFQLGPQAILRGTGYCRPCSRMEDNLGTGGFNAMHGHGGITATIIRGGKIQIGDSVSVVMDEVES